ncbi:MAG: YdcF family protein [Pseudomonadota bacterium]
MTNAVKSFRRNFKRIVLIAGLLAIGAFVTGFFFFVSRVNQPLPNDNAPADGIVVLTGGASRINDAVQLLADGRGRRLLITGLNPSTSRHDLARTMGKKSYLIECCVDLDYEAINTIGNADEAAKWAQANKFTRLLVVTSNYHMPRTLLELQRAYPAGVFMPQPVASTSIRTENWWLHLPSIQLLGAEYLKYLAALARLSFAGF